MSYPAHYEKFRQIAKSGRTLTPGFKRTNEEVFRFCNRFRLAKAFTGITAVGYRHKTTEGYSALFRVFLAFSAFELLMKIADLNHKGAIEICVQHGDSAKVQAIQSVPNNIAFFSFVAAHLAPTAKDLSKELKWFLDGNSTSIYTLARSIRHIFSHGHLTSYSNNVQPGQVIQICNIVVDFLLYVMNEEFKKRVA
jgi:hypothetical protein